MAIVVGSANIQIFLKTKKGYWLWVMGYGGEPLCPSGTSPS
jgi:hypothetical protein